jgi:hemerythrin-like domain-containing protein
LWTPPPGKPSLANDPTSERKAQVDAMKLLKADHDKVKKMLSEMEKTSERATRKRESMLAELKSELEVHEAIEEEIFYPALKEHAEARDSVLEAYEEHNVVDTLMGELERLSVDDETWGPKAKVMKENIEHHIEEEEGDMFKAARQVFEDSELDELGTRMENRKRSAGRELGVPVGR